MAAFVNDTEINLILEDLIREADELLVFLCPYFKLHEKLRDCLKLRLQDEHLRIIIVFGKNEDDPSKSLSKEDFEFLKSFPYIEIGYEKRLHAKYYANETKGVITSLNLHSYSQNNNIEVGVYFENKNLLKNLTSKTLGGIASSISDTENLAEEAKEFFIDVFSKAEKIFQKEPRFDSAIFGFSKKYTHSEVLLDRSDWFYKEIHQKEQPIARNPIGFTPKTKANTAVEKGFCIRTKDKITFNPSKPLSYSAYKSWAQHNNPDYKEKYCHSCGKGYTTSVRFPLCNECAN